MNLNEDGTPFRAILTRNERIIKMALKTIYSGKDGILKVYLDPSDLAKNLAERKYK